MTHFNPVFVGYNGVRPLHFWCQKVLPLVYDDSLSYYELLCKIVTYLNELVEDVTSIEQNLYELLKYFGYLQDEVNSLKELIKMPYIEKDNTVDEENHIQYRLKFYQTLKGGKAEYEIAHYVNENLYADVWCLNKIKFFKESENTWITVCEKFEDLRIVDGDVLRGSLNGFEQRFNVPYAVIDGETYELSTVPYDGYNYLGDIREGMSFNECVLMLATNVVDNNGLKKILRGKKYYIRKDSFVIENVLGEIFKTGEYSEDYDKPVDEIFMPVVSEIPVETFTTYASYTGEYRNIVSMSTEQVPYVESVIPYLRLEKFSKDGRAIVVTPMNDAVLPENCESSYKIKMKRNEYNTRNEIAVKIGENIAFTGDKVTFNRVKLEVALG